ncbi:autotransporter outer membrane beta-barrel domain-containing protein [Maricaulis maris]|uniref:autotransporter outer membrane beta-barrel domain-containing protein n=1 Tax=Maricaulis maris TaxID=74318 RepID=UPI0011C49B08|nr:autotransporter outer membrane beta-barrel domain-containing protein [Maricaulis maris]
MTGCTGLALAALAQSGAQAQSIDLDELVVTYVGSAEVGNGNTYRVDYLWVHSPYEPERLGQCVQQIVRPARGLEYLLGDWVAVDIPHQTWNADCNRDAAGTVQDGLAPWENIGDVSLHDEQRVNRNPTPGAGLFAGRPSQAPLSVVADKPVLDATGEALTIADGERVVDGYELFESATVDADGRLNITLDGFLELEDGLTLEGGEVYLDGILLAEAMTLNGGRFTVAEEGLYFDYSADYEGGITLNSGELVILGGLLTDWLMQTDGSTYVGPDGVYFDWEGAVINGGALQIAGIFDTDTLLQTGGSTWVEPGGLLYVASGETFLMNSDIRVDGLLDTVDLYLSNTDLSGSGAIFAGGNTVMFGGSIRPGRLDGVGGEALYLESDLFLRDGVIEVDLSAEGIDTLMVYGSADIDAEIRLNLDPNYQPLRGSRFTVVETAFGVASNNSSLTAPSPSPVLSYVLGVTDSAIGVELQAAPYASFAGSDQQRAVATALDAALSGGASDAGLQELAHALDYRPDLASLQDALQSASPSDTFAMDRLGFGISRAMADLVSQRGSLARDAAGAGEAGVALSERATAYFDLRQQWGSTRLPNDRFDIQERHGALGIDFRLSQHGMVGAAFSFSDYGAGRDGGYVQGEAVTLLGYVSLAKDSWYGQAYAANSWLDFDLSRRLVVRDAIDVAQAGVEADQFSAGFEMGAAMDLGAVSVGPVFQVQHGRARFDSYTEQGSGAFDAHLAGRDADETLVGLGGRVDGRHATALGVLELQGELGWYQDMSAGNALAYADLEGAPSAQFQVPNTSHDDGFAALDLGVRLKPNALTVIAVSLNADFGRGSDPRHGAQLSISRRF